MAKDISPNKLSKRDKRRVDHVRDRLRHQGVGEDEAMKRAVREVVSGDHSGRGGGSNSASDQPKRVATG